MLSYSEKIGSFYGGAYIVFSKNKSKNGNISK